jgi:hypothetical protein
MQVVYPICGGVDVPPMQRTACLRRVSTPGPITTELREFGTPLSALGAFHGWRIAQDCPLVALESTGGYGPPLDHVLAEVVEVVVAHARDGRQRPGKKTDNAEARWSAALLAHGLSEPSFLPPSSLRARRDLPRTRGALIHTRTQVQSRVHKVLEDTHVTVAHGVSDLFGKRGRRMLAVLIAGERDPQKLAARALGRLRRKAPPLELALAGQVPEHHARLIQGALELIDGLKRHIAELDEPSGKLAEPLAPPIAPLDSLPGVDTPAARDILAERGVAMQRFGSAPRRSAWAGMAPGHNARAGKRRRGNRRKGNRSLRRL